MPEVAAGTATNAICETQAPMFCCVDLLLTRSVKDLLEWVIASPTWLGQFCVVGSQEVGSLRTFVFGARLEHWHMA